MQGQMTAMSDYADEELVTRAQDSDDAAFGELMRRTSASSLRLAMSILKDRAEAEDEVQNSYLRAWRHLSQFQRESKFSTWMSRIVVNHCLMRLRKLRGTNFLYLDDSGQGAAEDKRPVEIADGNQTPEHSLGSKELSGLLQKEIGRLPPLLRQVLVLRDINELSTAEAAIRLGISTSAVKSRLLRARGELRNRLAKYQAPGGWVADQVHFSPT